MKAGHPMEAKKALAAEIVSQFHGTGEAIEAQDRWIKRFSERQTSDAPEVNVNPTEGEIQLARLLVEQGLASSRKEAERLISQGAVSLDGEKVSDPSFRLALKTAMKLLVKVGKLKLQRWVVK